MSTIEPGSSVTEKVKGPGLVPAYLSGWPHVEGWRSMPSVMALAGLLALVVRLAYLAAFRDSLFFSHLLGEARWNFDWAEAWSLGEWTPEGRAFPQPPLYSYWLSLIFHLFGQDLLVLRVIQALVGAGTAAAIAGAGFRAAGFAGGLTAGILAALSGMLVFLDGEILGANLLLALLAWSLFLLSSRPSVLAWIGSGLLLGLAALVHQAALVLAPAAALWCWLRTRHTAGPFRLRIVPGLLLVASFIPPFAVTCVNLLGEGTFVFIASNGGLDFYAGNHRFASGLGAEVPVLLETTSGWDQALAARQGAERAVGRALSSREVSNWWFHRGMDEIASHPGTAANLALRKIYYLINAHEIPGQRDPTFERPGILRLLLFRLGSLTLPWGILFPLAVIGFAGGVRIRAHRTWTLFLGAWFVLFGLALLPFFVNAELRTGAMIPLFVLAGAGLARGKEHGRAPVLAGLIALVLVNTSSAAIREGGNTRELSKLTESYLLNRPLEEAVTQLEPSHREHPKSVTTTFLLAQCYERSGRLAEALPLYEEAAQGRPEDADVHRYLGALLLRLGRFDTAAEALSRAVDLSPADAIAWSRLGDAFSGQGDPRRSAAAYAQAIRLIPHEPAGYASLAQLHLRQGEPEQAVRVLEAGVKRVRGSFDLYYLLALASVEADDLGRARAELDTALELRPEDPAARNLKEWLSPGRK